MTGEVQPIQTFRVQKRPGETIDYTLDARDQLEKRWRPDRDYTAGEFVRPARATGFDYECTTGGRTAATEPVWKKAIGQTNSDGSVTWTCRAAGSSALDTIAGNVAVTPPTGISATHQTTDPKGESKVRVAGGTAGQDYSVLLTVTTTSGQVLVYELLVEVRA